MNAQVTVVIPVWDAYAGPGLLEAVSSVAGQRCPHELIVVDNASRRPLPPVPDATVLTLPIRVSAGAARNAALTSIRTPYVVFLDADDALLAGALGLLVGAMQLAPGPAATFTILDTGSGERHRSPRPIAARLARRPPAFALANAIWSLLPTQGATIMRADAIRSCDGYGDRDTGEDWVLGASLTARGRIAFDERPVLSYRSRASSPGNAAVGRRVLLANAAAVRQRLGADPAVPGWLKALLPALAVAQAVAALGAYPASRAVRAAFNRDHRIARAHGRAHVRRPRSRGRSR